MIDRKEVTDILTEMLGVTQNDADHAAGAVIARLEAASRCETQYGVSIDYAGKKYVDTMYNGGFKTADSALFAAEGGYTKGAQTQAVQRTITTVYGPWVPIKGEK